MNDGLHCDALLPIIKSDFGKLWHCKPRGDSIEVITPFSTTTQKFVSVFITQRGSDIVVTDGGLLDDDADAYNCRNGREESEMECCIGYFSSVFGVGEKVKRDGKRIFFKKCNAANLVSSVIYDLCNFVVSVTSNASMPAEETSEEKSKETFRQQANGFLLGKYPETVKFARPIDGLDSVKFSAIVFPTPSTMSLIVYVTGSTYFYFASDLRRAIVNFELANKTKSAPFIKSRIALLDNDAEGYLPNRNTELIELLGTHRGSAVSWTEKEKLVELCAA